MLFEELENDFSSQDCTDYAEDEYSGHNLLKTCASNNETGNNNDA